MLRRIAWMLFPMVAASLLLAHENNAFACSCAEPRPIQETLEKSTAVFSGEVTRIESDQFMSEVTFQVDRAWKGVSEDAVTVRTSSQGSACGYPFEEGKSYLVYAYSKDGYSPLGTGSCGRNAEIEHAGEQLAVLGAGYIPQPIKHGDSVFIEQSGAGDPLLVIFGMGAAVAAFIAFLTLRHPKEGQ